MTASWPAAPFPQFFIPAATSQLNNNNVLRTAMETGSPKVRLRDNVWYNTWNATIKVTAAQKVQLETWFKTTAGGGTVPFLLNDNVTGNAQLYLMAGPPAFTHEAGAGAHQIWQAAIVLEEVTS